MSNQDFKTLFIDQLRDIYSAEMQLVEALPKMASAAKLPKLREAFSHHLQETKAQVSRLKKIFNELDVPVKGEMCEAMKGLIEEGEETIQKYSGTPVIDPALIAAAQRVEHYEIAVYGTLRAFAKELDLPGIADLLEESLKEEGNANKTLNAIAEGGFFTTGVNEKAMRR